MIGDGIRKGPVSLVHNRSKKMAEYTFSTTTTGPIDQARERVIAALATETFDRQLESFAPSRQKRRN